MKQINKDLLDILACPKCKTPVVQDEDKIKCTNNSCGLIYPIRDGIPVMLIEEADQQKTVNK
ncbi:Trm112 family protein [Verrucomicrobiota bacterium]